MYYQKELDAIKKSNRFRTREINDTRLQDFASNDYLGLGSKKKLFKEAYKLLLKTNKYAPKSSMLVNGYFEIHKAFEDQLALDNGFESGLVVGSGFLANMALIEGLVRKKDVLFIDEDYHASGILASKLVDNVIIFSHNNIKDLEEKIQLYKKNRIIIAIEGIYSMGGDIAPKEINDIALQYNAILIVDEAHSSGVIGDNLNGWFDYYGIKISKNHIKMGTLGKAYGSYGAYILSSHHITTYLLNRAKAIIYTTAPSLFDIALGLVSHKYIKQHKEKLKHKIRQRVSIVTSILGEKVDSLIVKIEMPSNQKALELQKILQNEGFKVGAIRQPTVIKPIIRVIMKLDMKKNNLINLINKIKDYK